MKRLLFFLCLLTLLMPIVVIGQNAVRAIVAPIYGNYLAVDDSATLKTLSANIGDMRFLDRLTSNDSTKTGGWFVYSYVLYSEASGIRAIGSDTSDRQWIRLAYPIADESSTYVGIGSGLASTIAKRNTMLGYNAGTAITEGSANTGIGCLALSTGTGVFPGDVTFYANTAIGDGAMTATTTGSYNTAVGAKAGQILEAGNSNTLIGYAAGDIITTGDKNICIGQTTDPPSATSSETLNIGNVIKGSLVPGSETLTFIGTTAYTPNVASNAVADSIADDGAITVVRKIMRVAGIDADAVLDTDPAINDGSEDGQIVIIQGTSDGHTVTIADNVNTQLNEAASCTLGDGDVIALMWDSDYSMWIELYRSNN